MPTRFDPAMLGRIGTIGSVRARHRLVATLMIGASIFMITVAAPTAAYGQDYVRQNDVTYPLKDAYGHVHPTCTGRAWIGQTASNSIEATSRVSCGPARPATNQTETVIAPAPRSPQVLAKKKEVCGDCSTVLASVSVAGGGPGSQYCVQGFGSIFTPISGSGGGVACITT